MHGDGLLIFGCADFTELSRSAAVGHILQLEQDSIGIGEVKIGGAGGRSTAVLHPHAVVVDQGTGWTVCCASRFEPIAVESLQDRVGIEVFHAETAVIDA